MFYNNIPSFSDDKARLGRYLGPAIESRLHADCQNSNPDRTICLQIHVELLTEDKLWSDLHKETCTRFDQDIEAKIGPAIQTTDFPEEDLTLEHDMYLDIDHPDPDPEDLEVTPEIGDNYIGAGIQVPRGGVLTRGKVIS